MTLEQQFKQLNYCQRQMALEIQKNLAVLEALVNDDYEAITNPEEGSILHPEYQVEQNVEPEDIPR